MTDRTTLKLLPPVSSSSPGSGATRPDGPDRNVAPHPRVLPEARPATPSAVTFGLPPIDRAAALAETDVLHPIQVVVIEPPEDNLWPWRSLFGRRPGRPRHAVRADRRHLSVVR